MIVTTCNLVEGTRAKCEKFWPDAPKDNVAKKIGKKGIEVELMEEIALTQHLILRKFKLNDPVFNRKDMIV
jgi:protein tyrosine phosphatase